MSKAKIRDSGKYFQRAYTTEMNEVATMGCNDSRCALRWSEKGSHASAQAGLVGESPRGNSANLQPTDVPDILRKFELEQVPFIPRFYTCKRAILQYNTWEAHDSGDNS